MGLSTNIRIFEYFNIEIFRLEIFEYLNIYITICQNIGILAVTNIVNNSNMKFEYCNVQYFEIFKYSEYYNIGSNLPTNIPIL